MLGLTAPQVMLMEALELVLLGKTKVEKLEMKVEFENCPLPLFLLEAGLMEVEGLVLLGPLLLLGVQVMEAVVRALRRLEPWWLRLVVMEVGRDPGVVTGLAVVRSHVSGDGFQETKAISPQFSSHVAFITRYLPDVTGVMTHQ